MYASMNDPDLWQRLPRLELPEDEAFDELSFSIPFDECLDICDGNKRQARKMYFYWNSGRFGKNHSARS